MALLEPATAAAFKAMGLDPHNLPGLIYGLSQARTLALRIGSLLQLFPLCLLVGIVVFVAAAASSAAESQSTTPTTRPQFRIDGGMHTALVRVMRHDPVRDRLFTASIDKTIRVWQLPDWRLISTMRTPSEPGDEGKLNALAVTPDGKLVAAAGSTGWTWDRTGSVYIYDAETGDMIKRIAGLPATVGYLAFSGDGSRLAIGLNSGAGLKVLETRGFSVVAEDREYAESVVYVEFSPVDNTLLTTAFDGYVRVYGPSHRLVGRQRVPLSQMLGGIRMSYDGRRAAFGFQDLPLMVVVSIPALTVLGTVEARDIPGQVSLCCPAWSRDGRHLFGNGNYTGPGDTPIYRWNAARMNDRVRITAARARIQSMYPLDDGTLVYGTEDPSFGVIDATGRRTRFIDSPVLDFRQGGAAFQVSDDGLRVLFPAERDGGSPRTFSIADLAYVPGSGHSADTLPPRRTSPKMRLQDWHDATAPLLNGKPLFSHPFETFRSFAISRDDSRLLMGTEFRLRLYDASGKVLWEVETPGVAWNVNIAESASLAVASFGDGTIRWYRLADGRETLGLFPHRNGTDWVLWRPDGYYVSSPGGDEYVGWQINRGKDAAPDFYRAVQFERHFYRPDLVRSTLETSKGRAAVTSSSIGIEQLSLIAPPIVRITQLSELAPDAGRRMARLTVEASVPNALDMSTFSIFVNNIPVTPRAERSLIATARKSFRKTLDVQLQAEDNEIRVEVFNGVSIGITSAHIRTAAGRPDTPKGRLFLVSVGARRFRFLPKDLHLDFTHRDAIGVSEALSAQRGKHFSEVHVRLLTDDSEEKPDRATILQALSLFDRAEADDTVVLFLASHGLSDNAGNYFFVPVDGTQADIDSVLDSVGPASAPSLIGWREIFDVFRNVSGRRILIVDTCHAKNMEGTFDSFSLAKRSSSSRFALVVASKGEEESQEYRPGQHGLFTYSLLQGLGPSGDANGDGVVTLTEAFSSAVPLVEKLRMKKKSQTPQLIAPAPVSETVLAITR